MSNLFKYTKRVLTSVLAAAVVLTAIPSTAFGAELPDEDIVEVFEEQEAEVAEAGEEAVTTDGASDDEKVIIEEGDEEAVKETDDIQTLYFLNAGTDTAPSEVPYGTASHVAVRDPLSENGAKAYLGTDADKATAAVLWDGDTDFSFDIEAKAGYFIDEDAVLVNIGHVTDMTGVDENFVPKAATDGGGYVDGTVARKGLAYTVSVASDKTTATITIKNAYLKDYRTKRNSAGGNYGLLIQIPATAGTPKEYTMKISSEYPAPIPSSRLKVKVDGTFTAIADIGKNYIVSGKKITGVEIYVGDDTTAATGTPLVADTDYTYTYNPLNASPDYGTLTMLAPGILKGAKKDEGLTIVFQSETYSITGGFATTTAWDGSDSSLKFTEGSGDVSIRTFDKNPTTQADIKATLETNDADRILESIKVTHTDSSGDVQTATITNEDTTNKYLVIPKNSGSTSYTADQSFDGTGWGTKFISDLTVEATTAEKVTTTVDGAGYEITSLAADTSYVPTGKDLVIAAKAKANNKISKIEYVQTINGTEKTELATDNNDGTWTVPASAMVRTTAIKVTTGTDEETLKTVKKSLGSNSKNCDISEFTVKGVKFDTTIDDTGVPDKQDDQAYAFKVTPTSSAIIKGVGYRALDSEDEIIPLTATKVAKDGTAYYSIPATFGGPVEIVITGSKEVAVTKSANPKVDIMVNGAALGTSNTTEKDVAYTFAVVPKDSNVTVTKVQYNVNAGTTVDASALRTESTISGLANPYTIAAAEVTGPIAIYVQTLETVADGGDYIVDFTGYNGGTTLAAAPTNANASWDYAYNAKDGSKVADKTDITGYKRNSKNLLLNQNATATLTPQILKNDSTLDSVGTIAKTEFEVSDGSEDVIKVTGGTTAGTVQGVKFGSSKTLNFVVTQDTYDSDKDENLVKVTGSQIVEVKPRAVLTFAAPSQEFVDETGTTIAVSVQSGALVGSDTKYTTKSALETGLGANTSSPAFTCKWTPVSGSGVAVYANAVSELSTTAVTRSGYKESLDPTDPVSFNLELKDEDGTVYKAATPVVLYPTEVKKYIAVPVVTVIGGGEYNKAVNTDAVTIAAEDLNKADITYSVYEVNPESNSVESGYVEAGDFTTADDIETLIEAPIAPDTRWARPVLGATWAFTPKADYSAYVKGNGTGNVFSVEALKKAPANYTVDAKAKVGHIEVPANTVKFTVDKNQGLKKILMKVNDPAQKNSTAVTSLKLNDKYYKENDPYVSVTPVYTTTPAPVDAVNNGYTFRVTANSEFTLPTQDDFVSTDPNRVLVGWEISTQNAGDILGEAALSAKKFAPGAKIVVVRDFATAAATGALTYGIAPVWADRYSVYAKQTATGLDVDPAPGFYIDLGEKDSDNNPVTDAQLTTDYTNTSIRKDGATPIGATVLERFPMSTADTDDSALIYPATGTAVGTITWIAYDAVNSSTAGGVDTSSTELTPAQILNPSPTQAVSLGINTVLDPTELAKGNLKGQATADGSKSSWLHAVYNYADGKKIVSDKAVKISLDLNNDAYTVFLDGLKTATASGVELGQTIKGSTFVEIYEGVVSTALTTGNKYGFTWKVTPEDALTIEPSTDDFEGNTKPEITVNKKPADGKIKVQLTYNDLYGKSATSEEVEFTVKDPSVQIKLVADAKGTAMTTPLIEAKVADSSKFYVQLLDGEGNPIAGDGSWSWTTLNTNIIGTSAATGNGVTGTGLVKEGTIVAKGTGSAPIDTLGETTLTLNYTTAAGKTYTLADIPAKTYSAITFDATTHAQLKDGTKVTAAGTELNGGLSTGGNITASVSGTPEKAGTSVIKKYYKEDVVDNKFVLDTAPYTATYTGTGKEYVEFAGWQKSTTNSGVIDADNPAVTELEVAAPANVTLYPNFTDTAVKTISTNVDKIVLDNAKVADKEFATFTVSTTDKTTLDKIYYTNKGDYDFVKSEPQNNGTALTFDTITQSCGTRNTKVNITYSPAPSATDTSRTYVFGVKGVAGEAGKATFTISSQNSDVTKDVTVIVKGAYNAADGKEHYMLESGEDAKDTSVEITKGTVHYYDADGAIIANGVAKDADGNFVALKSGKVQKGYQPNVDGKGHATYSDPTTGIITPNAVATIEGVRTYFIGEDGLIVVPTVATGDKYAIVGTETDKYAVDNSGKILTKAAFEALGVESIVIADKEYIVTTDDKVVPAKEYYYTSHQFNWTWNKETMKPDVTVSVVYTADDGSTKAETDVVVTDLVGGEVVNKRQTWTAKYTATYGVKGSTEPKVLTESKTFNVEDGSTKVYTYKSHFFDWAPSLGSAVKPEVTATVTYTVTEEGKADTEETLPASVTVSDATIEGKYKVFTASLESMDGVSKSEVQKYNAKTGKKATGDETDDDSPSEPAESKAYNLFYTDTAITIAIPDGVKRNGSTGYVEGSGKWTSYFDINASNEVTVKSGVNRKDAAKAANSTIVAPILDSDDNVVGEFEYSLPVFYQKPSLKLTSTSGSVNKTLTKDQELFTTVTAKKSSGAYEPLDLTADDVKYEASKGSATATAEGKGLVKVTARDAASGKISVQPSNWAEAIKLSYTVKGVNKDVLTASTKQIILNTNATNYKVQTVHVELNNGEISEDDGVEVVLPNKWSESGVEISEGVNNGKVVNSDITFAPTDKLKKGNYSVTFKKGNVKVSVQVKVVNTALTGAVTFKVKSKINAVTGQKMVLEPQYKGITGPLEEVSFATLDDTYELNWDAERGTVIIGVAEGKTVTKGDFQKALKVKVADEEFDVNVKTKIVETKPTIKIDKIELPMSKYQKGTAEGTANVLSTYKLGGKTFVIKPSNVKFTDGIPADDDGWFLLKDSNVQLHWNADDGTIELKGVENTATKTKNVKVEVYYNGLTSPIKKSLTLKLLKNQ